MAEGVEKSEVFDAIQLCEPSAWHMVGSPNAKRVVRRVLSSDAPVEPAAIEGGKNQDLPILQIIEAATVAKVVLAVWADFRKQEVILSKDQVLKEVEKSRHIFHGYRIDWIRVADAVVLELSKSLKPEEWLKK